jgi:ionotropic glutamate receptor
MKIAFLMLLVFSLFLLPNGIRKSLAARPSVVSIGSILQLNSTTGGVSDVAIHAAVDDINSDPTVLNGTMLRVDTRDTNCDDGFLGMVQGTPSLIPIPFFISLFNTACFHSKTCDDDTIFLFF